MKLFFHGKCWRMDKLFYSFVKIRKESLIMKAFRVSFSRKFPVNQSEKNNLKCFFYKNQSIFCLKIKKVFFLLCFNASDITCQLSLFDKLSLKNFYSPIISHPMFQLVETSMGYYDHTLLPLR